MIFSIFLIILGFVHIVTCSEDHATNNSCNVCTLSWFRRKRDLKEYTRWRYGGTNAETTQEFIVKVLEEDASPSYIKDLVAINIEPLTKAREKIIIGGPIRPSLTTQSELDMLNDYTRFGPPITLPVTGVEGNIAPIKLQKNEIAPIRPPGHKSKFRAEKNPLRDESPPANPRFLPKLQTLGARQYAPIAPVMFTKRSSLEPLTPRSVDKSILSKAPVYPTRTHYADLKVLKRTSELLTFLPFAHDMELKMSVTPTRTSHPPKIFLHRTSYNLPTEDDDFGPTSVHLPTEDDDFGPTSVHTSDGRKYIATAKSPQSGLIESYLSYNDLTKNDADDTNSLKTEHSQSTTESYDDNNRISNDHFIQDSVSVNDSKELENTTDTDLSYSNYEDEDISVNTTLNETTESIFDDVTLTQVKNVLNNTITNKNKSICSILKLRPLSFNTPQTLHEIVTQLKQWAEESPVAKWVDITDGNLTIMENPIYMMIVDDPTSGQIMSAKHTVMIVAGIQGRDHHAVTAAMYVLYQLIDRSDAHLDLLTKFRFWIIPVFNPDGYDYSLSFPARRDWTKNLRQSWDSCKGSRSPCATCEDFGLRCTIQPCYGVNLDRNFDYQWIPTEELRAEHPCGSLYAGLRQLSEAETQAFTHFLHDQHTPLYTFIAFKEGDVLGIMYPYSHTRKRRAFDHIYRLRASKAAAAAHSISGRFYIAGQTSEFLPLYAGGIEDWVDGHLGIDNTYTVMLFRRTDSQNSELVTERVVHEAYAAMDTLLLQSLEPLGSPEVTFTRSQAFSQANTLFLRSITLIAVVLGFG